MNKWIRISLMTLIYAAIWLVLNYVYYGTVKPVGVTIGLSLVYGLCMTGVELFFHKDRKEKKS